MYSRLRFIQCAALIFFGIIIALGVPPLLVTAVRQPPVAGSKISDGPAAPAVPAVEVPPAAESTPEQPAERREEGRVPQELPQQAETQPAKQAPAAPTAPPTQSAIDDAPKGATADVSSSVENSPAKPPTEIQQAATPSPELAQEDETKGLRQEAPVPAAAPNSDDGSKAATADVSRRPETAPKPPEQTQEPTAPSKELMRKGDSKGHDQAAAAAAADEKARVATTPMATRARVSAAKNKKAAHADRSAKRSANESVKSARKPADGLKDIPVSAYAADGTQRRIVIRPTSVQDVYYYSRGRSAPPSGVDGSPAR